MKVVENNLNELDAHINMLLSFKEYLEENGVRVSSMEDDDVKVENLFKEAFISR